MGLIINKLRQPVIVKLNSGRSILILSRESAEIANSEISSADIQNKINKNCIIVIEDQPKQEKEKKKNKPSDIPVNIINS